MTWVTWRQSRTEMLIAGAILVTLAISLLWTGFNLRSDFHSPQITGCLASSGPNQACANALNDLGKRIQKVEDFSVWLNVLPVLLAMLFAAPAVLDLEQGTFRLAWTQGITRPRWLGEKIAFGFAGLTVATLALMALWMWWRSPFNTLDGSLASNRFESMPFANAGPVVVAYAIFGFALCLAAGTVLRRSVPAFGIALVGFIAIRVGIETKLRSHYLHPLKYFTDDPTLGVPSSLRDAFIITSGPSDRFGHMKSWDDPAVQQCFTIKGALGLKPTDADITAAVDTQRQCFHDHNLYFTTIYQPSHRFWIFQGIESAIFLGMAAILLGITFYWVTRRIAR
jgi:hypothetical protein